MRQIAAPIALTVAGVALYASCTGPAPGEEPTSGTTSGTTTSASGAVMLTADRTPYCGGLSGTPTERVDACLADLAVPTLSLDATAELVDIAKGGKVLVTGPAIGFGGEEVPLATQPSIRDAMLGTDEGAFAKQLLDAGYRGLVVYRDMTGAVDRDRVVLSRLAQHDELLWFQLRYVTTELLVYTIRSSEASVRPATGSLLVSGLRARLEGRTPPPQSWKPEAVRLIGGMRLQGSLLVMRHATTSRGTVKGEPIEVALDDLADKMRRRWEREIEIYGHGRLEDRLEDARIEIHVVMERAAVEPRSRYQIFDLFEVGVDGMMLRAAEGTADDDHFTYMPGSEGVAKSFASIDAFLQHATREFDWRDRRPWEDPKTRLDIVRDVEFLETSPGGGAAVQMVRGMPVEPLEDVDDAKVRDMLVDGGEWWLRNMRSDGSILYKYWPDQNRASTDYNEVRHILAARDLAATYEWRNDPRYLVGSRKAMDWLLQFEVHPDTPSNPLPNPPAGSILFRYPRTLEHNDVPNQKLGTVAVALLGWVEWAKATGSHDEDARIREMANYVLSRQQPDGRFEPYDVPAGHPSYGEKNDIVPGEAALALGIVAEYFGEKEWLAFYPKFLDYYEPWFDTRAARKQATGRWPIATYSDQDRLDLVQFGPWSVMAARQYYHQTHDERAAEFGLRVADWMIDNYQWSSERAPFSDYVGGYYKLPSELPAMQTFCYSEGTAAAYAMALEYDPTRAPKYEKSTREAIRFMELMQYDSLDSYAFARPDIIHGGIKYTLSEGKIRIDYVGHAMSTLKQYLDARKADPAAKFALLPIAVEPGSTPPTPWLDGIDIPSGSGEGNEGEEGGE